MRARVVIGADGQINVFADEGTFEEATARTVQFFQKLQIAGGLKFDSLSQPEQHRHDGTEVHIHTCAAPTAQPEVQCDHLHH